MLYFYLFTKKIIRLLKEVTLHLQFLNELFWLSIAGKSLTDKIDTYYYSGSGMYRNREYNLKGLLEWESEMIDSYFTGLRRVLVGGAGGGREVIALIKLGFEVIGFECHPQLASVGNKLLCEEGFPQSIAVTDRDSCPEYDTPFDGVVLGWGMYMLIRGKNARIRFLKSVRQTVGAGAPLLLSFFHRDNSRLDSDHIIKVANRIRKVIGKEPLEIGDRLSPNLVHYFTSEEIEKELEDGGFKPLTVMAKPYGHAVARAV